MLTDLNDVTWMAAWEYFIVFCHYESFKAYFIELFWACRCNDPGQRFYDPSVL